MALLCDYVHLTGGSGTYGAWDELVTTTPFSADAFMVHLRTCDYETWAVDIGIGAAGSEVTIATLAGLPFNQTNISPLHGVNHLLPIRLPKGQRISARIYSSGGGVESYVSLSASPRHWNAPVGFSRVDCIGLTSGPHGTPLASNGSPYARSAYVQLAASCPSGVKAIALGPGWSNDATVENIYSMLFYVAIGSAGSEVDILREFVQVKYQDWPANAVMHGINPIAIAAGQRIAVAIEEHSSASRNYDPVLYLFR